MPDIFYFSPTGTGKAISEILRKEFLTVRCFDLTSPEARALSPDPDVENLFTLIFPVYAHGIPTPVRQWLSALPERRGPVCLICTYGSISAGHAIAEAAELCRRKGRYVVAAAELPGPHSYDCAHTYFDLKRAGETDPHSVVRFFEAVIRKSEEGGNSVTLAGGKGITSFMHQELLAKLATRYPAIIKTKCLNCNKCNAVCPVAAIKNHAACIRCAACVRNCPSGARELRFRMPIPPIYLRLLMKERPPRFIL